MHIDATIATTTDMSDVPPHGSAMTLAFTSATLAILTATVSVNTYHMQLVKRANN